MVGGCRPAKPGAYYEHTIEGGKRCHRQTNKQPDADLCRRVIGALHANQIEFRRGTSGGGNQLRQPYLRRLFGPDAWKEFPRTDHVHFFGMYIGNYPDLERERILELCELLNKVRA